MKEKEARSMMTQRHEAARLLQATESCMVGNGEEREEGQLGRCCVMLILGAVNVHQRLFHWGT